MNGCDAPDRVARLLELPNNQLDRLFQQYRRRARPAGARGRASGRPQRMAVFASASSSRDRISFCFQMWFPEVIT